MSRAGGNNKRKRAGSAGGGGGGAGKGGAKRASASLDKLVIPHSQTKKEAAPAAPKKTLSVKDEINKKLAAAAAASATVSTTSTTTSTTTISTISTTTLQTKKIAKSKSEPAAKKPRVESAAPSSAPISSNWKALQKALPKPRKKPQADDEDDSDNSNGERRKKKKKALRPMPPPIKDDKSVTKLIALDCEMVGVGIDGKESMLARVCIVNSFGNVIYDKFVKPRERVVDYRTWVSGVTRADMNGSNAFPFAQVQKEVAELIKDKLVVGHGLKNDFKALLLSHPFANLRDTAMYRPLQRSRGKPRKLRYLTNKILGIDIQDKSEGAHDPALDARAALLLYKHLKRDWEELILRKQKRSLRKKKKVEKAKKKKAAKQAKSDAKKKDEAAAAGEGDDDGEPDFDDSDDDDGDASSYNVSSGFNFDDDEDDDSDSS